MTLTRDRGVLLPGVITSRLPNAAIGHVARALLPVLQEWKRRERENNVLQAAAVFGPRARLWDDLAVVIERVVRDTVQPGIAQAGLRLLARHWPHRFRALVPALLAQDPSWITQAPVQVLLHRRRQDLLTPFLGRRAYKGRFSTGRTYLVLPFSTGFQRWTPAQQRLFAASLSGLIDDEARDSPALLHAVRQLAALPHIAPDKLVRLAASDASRPAARDSALRGLGQRDTDDGIPVLLAALDDARARIAAYALRRGLMDMPAARALAVLDGVRLHKVTVAKEVVRLVGDLPGKDAGTWLLARDADAEAGRLHRDVRVALLRALWSRLEQPETWPILQRAAASADPAVAVAVARIPRSGPVVRRRGASRRRDGYIAGASGTPECGRTHCCDAAPMR